MQPLLFQTEQLETIKKKLEAGSPCHVAAHGVLIREANAALERGPYSVMDKTNLPPSGDKHDYLSYGTYWWPNPDTADHLPYVRRDGERNPDFLGNASDTDALHDLSEDVLILTLAAYYGGGHRHAQHAALLLRTWFVSPETRMNPHLEYGQAIPGICEGRNIGIIDTNRLLPVIDCAIVLAELGTLSCEDFRAIKAWFASYLHWLCDSEKGQQEHLHPNNHGTWCSAQMAGMALFTGNQALAKDLLEQAIVLHFEPHITADGRQPEELARTRAFSYSKFNLRGLITLAVQGEQAGVDLWHYENKAGGSILKAMQWLAQFSDPAVPWEYPQITEMDRGDLLPLLLQVNRLFPKANLWDAVEKLPLNDVCGNRAWLMYERQ